MKLLRLIVGGALVLGVAACDANPIGIAETGLAGPELAAPTLAAGRGPVVESARGAGSYTLDGLDLDGDGVDDPIDQVLGFNAKRHADGSLSGQIEYHQSFLDFRLRFHATITCMEIYDGNRVKFGGVVTQSNDPDPAFGPGVFIWFQAIDNGEGSGVPADLATGSGFGDEAANEAFCANPAGPNPIFVSEVSGNVQVN